MTYGSDPERIGRAIKEQERRLSRLERRRRQQGAVTQENTTENGIEIETNVICEVIEDGQTVQISETHNTATAALDEYLANCLKHIGPNPTRPSRIVVGDGNREFDGEMNNKVGDTPITESFVSQNNTYILGELDSTQCNGNTLREIGVAQNELFNHAPIEPEIDKNERRNVQLKIEFVFLHP